jgi:diketogulonate reductase-like aldo/keto reductase
MSPHPSTSKSPLPNGVDFPAVGFGTYKAEADVIRMAIAAGYRYFDTASFYGTEPAIAAAVRQSGLPRGAFTIASKIWKTDMGYAKASEAIRRTLDALETDYLDVCMVHWPLPTVGCTDWKELDLETWRAMEEFYRQGKIRTLGVSNFLPHHLENLISNVAVAPSVAQLEFHPGYTQEAAVKYCFEHNMIVQAWSPMGRGRVLADPLILEMAGKYRATPAQVCLRFAIHKGVMPLPKASSIERMKENLDCVSFELEPEDIWRLDTMPPAGWSGEHPDRERVRL